MGHLSKTALCFAAYGILAGALEGAQHPGNPGGAAASEVHNEHGQAVSTPALEKRINPHGSEAKSVSEVLADRPPDPIGLYPRKDWPPPVEDQVARFSFLADVLEYRLGEDDDDFRWDIESWYGGDFNRLWFKTEGEHSATDEDYDLDLQLLYGRFIRKYYDFQVGARAETRLLEDQNESRGHAVIGLEGLVPYRFEIEPLLFISQDGGVSGRFTATRDLLLTQRLILQARLETSFAIQEVREFATGSGINDIEVGLRLRYEIRREVAPYIGFSYERSLFGTEDLVRAEGEDPSRLHFVAGLRFWF